MPAFKPILFVLILSGGLLALSACGETDDTYYSDHGAAARRCAGQGLKPGTKEYDHCVQEEISAQRLEQLHEEHERRQQEIEDYRSGRYTRY